MSEKTKNILDKTNRILGILCAVMFVIAACRVTYVAKIDRFQDNSKTELIINTK